MPRRPTSPVPAYRGSSAAAASARAGVKPGASKAGAARSGARARPGARSARASQAGESRPARIARLVSVRAMVLGVVLLSAFTLLFPTVRAYLGQRAELDALAAQVAQAEQEEDALSSELDRWQDPAYVAAQARARLSFVMEGETSYRVIDPEVVVEEPLPEGATTEPGDGPALPAGGAVTPWYTTVWESMRVAGAETAEPTQVPDDGAAQEAPADERPAAESTG